MKPKLFISEYSKQFEGSRIGIAAKQHIFMENWDNILDNIRFLRRFDIELVIMSTVRGSQDSKMINKNLPEGVEYKIISDRAVEARGFDNLSLEIARQEELKKLVFLERQPLKDMNNQIIDFVTKDNFNTTTKLAKNCTKERLSNILDPQAEHTQDYLKRIHIISNADNSIKQELFSLDGVGTMIARLSDDYQISFSSADANDISPMHKLLQSYKKEGYLKARSLEYVDFHIHNFYKIKLDNIMSGCIEKLSLEPKCVEMGAVVVANRFANNKMGVALIKGFIDQMILERYKSIFVSTANPKLFHILENLFGFQEIINKNMQSSVLQNRINKSPNNKFYMKYLS